jgi:hypothetical protein
LAFGSRLGEAEVLDKTVGSTLDVRSHLVPGIIVVLKMDLIDKHKHIPLNLRFKEEGTDLEVIDQGIGRRSFARVQVMDNLDNIIQHL